MPVERGSPAATVQPAASDREFMISRTFDAPRALVFRAWINPKHMARWWGPKAFSTPVCQMDVRVGGAYRIVMRSAEGVDYPITGVFREILEPSRIVMTMDPTEHPSEWHDLVNPSRPKGQKNPAGIMLTTVTFDEQPSKSGVKTNLTVRTRFDTAVIRDAMVKMGMNEGWSQSLDRLAELLPQIKK